MAWWRKGNASDDGLNNNINLFSDNRVRENRLRQSITSIDDLECLMIERSARRQSIISMMNEEAADVSNRTIDANALFKISPDNIRNLLALNKKRSSSSSSSSTVEGGTLNHLPNLVPANGSSSSLSEQTLSSTLTTSPQELTSQSSLNPAPPPSWFNKLNALSRWEHRQERIYHETLEERQKLRERHPQHQFRNSNQTTMGRRIWPGRKEESLRDGLDVSRNVDLCGRDSIHALADSFTELSATSKIYGDDDDSNNDNTRQLDNEGNSNRRHNNNNCGYLQDTRPSTRPKTQKCVLDLVA